MKRNSTTKKIISLLLTVIMLGSCFVCVPLEISALENAVTCSAGFPQSDEVDEDTNEIIQAADPARSLEGFGTIGGKNCVNNTKFKSSDGHSLFFLDNKYSKLSYCIETGTDVKPWHEIQKMNKDDAVAELARRVGESVNKVSMTGPEMYDLLCKVLGYGYDHEAHKTNGVTQVMAHWHNIMGNSNQRYRFCYAYATQILIWELTSGERDANFNYLGAPREAVDGKEYMSIYNHCIKSNNPLKNDIDDYYKQIEANVKGATKNIDPEVPDEPITLKVNYNTSVVTGSIPDANGLFKDTTSINGLPGAILEHKNGKLNITIPFLQAKEGRYKIPYTVNYQVPERVDLYIDGNTQDMIAAGGLISNQKTGEITIIVPHHHEFVPHVIVPTCTTEGSTCMVCRCGDIYTDFSESVRPLNHNYETSAWVVGHQATCTQDGEEVQICERCNTVIATRVIPKTGHSGVWIIETEPTADHEGQMVLYCTKCGSRTETSSYESHDHEYGYQAVVREATCVTNGLKGKFCRLCGVCYETSTIAAGHSELLTWVTTIQPTCTEKGETSAFCNDCGHIVTTKTVEATGHSEGTWLTSVAPYCGLAGEDVCVCDKCGEIVDSRETEALSHDEGVWKTTKDPTCELEGEKVKSCTRCGHIIETEAIEALGHDDGVWKIDIEATPDLDGNMNRYCTRCSMVLETKTFTLHTHEEGYKVTLLQNTCTRDGEKGTACGICGAVYISEAVPALGHDYSDFYTENNGSHSKSCSRCHYEYSENCNYEVTESRVATCTTAGYETHKCTVCDYTYTDSFVAPYGHNIQGKWISEGKSTHMRYCTECGVMEISKHVWGEYFSNNDGDIIEDGSKTCYCIYCAESKTIGKPASIINSTYKAAMGILDFLIRLFEVLREYSMRLIKFVEQFK